MCVRCACLHDLSKHDELRCQHSVHLHVHVSVCIHACVCDCVCVCVCDCVRAMRSTVTDIYTFHLKQVLTHVMETRAARTRFVQTETVTTRASASPVSRVQMTRTAQVGTDLSPDGEDVERRGRSRLCYSVTTLRAEHCASLCFAAFLCVSLKRTAFTAECQADEGSL